MNKSGFRSCICCLAIFAVSNGGATVGTSQTRQWSDATGNYAFDAEVVMFNDKTVVLKRADHELVAIPLAELSEVDREYLKSPGAMELQKEAEDDQATLVLQDGTKIVGRIIDFAQRDLSLHRRRGNFYVNDRNLDNLPKFYQQILPHVVAHFETLPTVDRRGLEAWITRQRGRARALQVEGVLIELENGDLVAVPFFLLPENDRKLWQGYWKNWQTAQQDERSDSREDLAFLLKSLGAARAEDALVQRQIAQMQLKMQAVETGLTTLWEVTLYPDWGNNSWPQWVVVPGRDSNQATINALNLNPGYVAGPVRRVSSRR